MTEHVFDGHADTTYAEKDAYGQPLGTVIPGEIRHLAQALDHWWREATGEDRERWAAIKAKLAEAAEGSGGEPEAASTPPPAPAAAAPAVSTGQPAPPAVLPQPPSASTDTQEG